MDQHYPFVNTPLPYAHDALEPYIDAQTMRLHHEKHLQTYINNLNQTLKPYPRLHRMTLQQLLSNVARLPREIQTSVRNNAGGVYNHRLYFNCLAPHGGEPNRGRLLEAVDRQFGSFEGFKRDFREAALSVFGSGYAWLVQSRRGLEILTTPNQNAPLEQGFCPVLTLDVWEHAYYLMHQNRREEYIVDWFKIINWDAAENNYSDCQRR